MTKQEVRARLDEMREQRCYDHMLIRTYLETLVECILDVASEILATEKS